MKISIKCRFTDKVIFEGEYESTRYAVEAAVKAGANLAGANLAGANLAGANLARANLDGAYLARANLDGAYLAGEKLIIAPMQILGLRWFVLITPEYMTIGCQRHKHEEWSAFSRTDISQMDSGAWDWWKAHKPLLMAACELHRKEAEKCKEKEGV